VSALGLFYIESLFRLMTYVVTGVCGCRHVLLMMCYLIRDDVIKPIV